MYRQRRPSRDAREAMSRAALAPEEAAGAQEKAEGVLSRQLGRKVRLVSSGNAAILAALSTVGKRVLIPDQGGWKGFRTLPQFLGKEVVEYRTDWGYVKVEGLKEALKEQEPDAFLFSSLAGYMARQPVREIAGVCRGEGVVTIEDISGAFSDSTCARGDLVVCSTGSPKVINLAWGGFIGGDNLEGAEEILRSCKASPLLAPGLLEELRIAPRVLEGLYEGAEAVKEELPRALFQGSHGISVGIPCRHPRRVATRLRKKGLETDLGRSLITTCPLYDRFLERGIALELKKIEVLRYSRETFARMGEKVNEAL